MRVFIDGNEFVVITEPKSIRIDLAIKINKSIVDHIKFIVSPNKCLAEYPIKNEIWQLLFKYEHGHKKRT